MTNTLADMFKLTETKTVPLALQTTTLYGQEGTGKSGIAAGIEKHIYWNLEAKGCGYQVNAAPENTWARFSEFLVTVWKGDTTYDGYTTVIDTFADLYRLCVAHHLAKMGLRELPAKKLPNGDGPSDIGRRILDDFELHFNMMLRLSAKGRMGFVFVAHEYYETVENDFQKVSVARPDGGMGVLRPWFDKSVCEWLSRRTQNVLRTFLADSHPTTLEPFPDGTRYLISCTPQNAYERVKSRNLPKFVPASWQALETAYEKGSGK